MNVILNALEPLVWNKIAKEAEKMFQCSNYNVWN